jgi:hypothetical protein
VHLTEFCCSDRVVSVKGIRDPVATAVVGAACYLRFISYALTLTALRAVGLYWWRLSSRVLAHISSCVLLLGSSGVGDIVLCISRGITHGVGGCVGGNIGSKVDRLHYFIFTSALFSHGLKGALL